MASLSIFIFPANVGIRSDTVTGVQACALLIFINAGSLDIDGNTVTLSGSGGNWLSGGTAAGNRSVVGTTGTIALGGAKTFKIGRAHVRTPVTVATRTPACAWKIRAGITTLNRTLRVNAGGS